MTDVLDFTTIATRVAALWANVTPPSGYESITQSTHLLPGAVVTPAMLVKPPVGNFEYGGGQGVGELAFPCEFYLTEGADMPSNAAKVYAWMGPLFTAPAANYNLGPGGIAGVIDLTLTECREGVLTYSKKDFIGIQFTARVRVKFAYDVTGT